MTSMTENNAFLQEYTAPDAVKKYTRATAGFGVSYLLDHDYKRVYLDALGRLPWGARHGIRMLEFGCGGGMNLLHLVSVLGEEGIQVEKAIGTDFSPVLIEAARSEAENCLRRDAQQRVEFHLVNNESMLNGLSAATGLEMDKLANSFHFILGVNTIRYCHAARRELQCARDIFDLLVPGGMCVVIDMNNKFPLFRSDLRRTFGRAAEEEECYVPTLEEYTVPFVKTGFEVIRSKHFCWVPHSSGRSVCRLFSGLTPLLDLVAPSRAMRSLVVSRKPE